MYLDYVVEDVYKRQNPDIISEVDKNEETK